MLTAYCMKCKRKVDVKNPKQVTMRNNRPGVKGVCPVCGREVFRIGRG